MRLKFLIPMFPVFLFLASSASAQISASITSSEPDFTNPQFSSVDENGETDWTFYFDRENKVYYIDFETINVNLNELLIKNEVGKVVLKKSLWDLPVNTLYELDLRHLKPGKYRVVLKTFNGDLNKDLDITG